MSRTRRNKDPRYFDETSIHRDKKDKQKPDSIFKKIMSHKRKAKIRNALRSFSKVEDVEEIEIPRFKKTNEWDWN